MYAIVQVGGRQYRASAGDRIVVDRMAVEPGESVELSDVRMLVVEEGDDGETMVGRPQLEGVMVRATALGHLRGRKIRVFKYKPKKRYRRTRGFRADLTELLVDGFGRPGESEPGTVRPRRSRVRATKPSAETAGAEAAGAEPRESVAPETDGPTPETLAAEVSAPRKPVQRRRRAQAASEVAGAAAEEVPEANSGESDGA